MTTKTKVAWILRTARETAGLSQRELAARARTTQAVVARIELGRVSPGIDTLGKLVDAAGFELALSVRKKAGP